MTNKTTQTGHDAPISDRSDDFYDRWPVARSISRIIATAPPQWSTRIGLFGPWGDGKTSVLNFLEQQQREAGNIVIRYAPWGASTPDEVWRDFGQVLIQGLERHSVKFSRLERGISWAKSRSSKVSTGVKVAGKLAELSGHAPGASAGASFASTLIGEKLTFTSEDITRLTQNLGARKVVVFIDDLDRTDAVVIPKLLLVLRELLDFAQFAFVLAFDQRIVASALEGRNESWGKSGQTFLDKVIDFRVELPRPTAEQVSRLGVAQFAKLCPFVPKAAVEDIARLLPTNPRKIKLIARTIASTQVEVERHEDEELDWSVILLLALIRTESEALANRLLEVAIDDGGTNWFEYFADKKSSEVQRQEELEKLFSEFPELTSQRTRTTLLVGAWRSAIPTVPGDRIRYQAMFALSPHCITWGEFKQFFSTWRLDKTASSIKKFVADRTDASEARHESVEREMSETVLGHYSTVLEKASYAGSKTKHKALMSEGADGLDLLLQCLVGDSPVYTLPRAQMEARWTQLFKIACQWRHFNANADEPELRTKEVQTLLDFGVAIGAPLFIYEQLNPVHLRRMPSGDGDSRLVREMCETLCAAFEPDARTAALTYVTESGGIQKMLSGEEHQAARFLLSSPKSPMYTTHKEDLVAALESRRNTPNVVADANDYLDLLLSALQHGDGSMCTAAERQASIKDNPGFMGVIWSLCISEPSQYRMLSSLRTKRQILLDAGVSEAILGEPDWLKDPVTI